MVASTQESSGDSAMWILPENSLKRPRTFTIIEWRPTTMIEVCGGSNSQVPATGMSRPFQDLVIAASLLVGASDMFVPPLAQLAGLAPTEPAAPPVHSHPRCPTQPACD